MRFHPPKDPATGAFRKIAFTPAQDQILRDLWNNDEPNYKNAKKASALLKFSVGACIRRAVELGIYNGTLSSRGAYAEPFYWTDRELEVLENTKLRSLLVQQGRLKAIGSTRSLHAIARQIRTNKIREDIGLTATDVSAALGVSHTTLLRWRREGKIAVQRLPPTTVQTLYKENAGAREVYTRKDIRKFLFEYPGLVNLKRVDQAWFMDLINSVPFPRTLVDAALQKTIGRDGRPAPTPLYEPGEESGPSSLGGSWKQQQRGM